MAYFDIYAFNRFKPALLVLAIAVGIFAQCNQARAAQIETAIVAGGCFWCVEHDFEQVRGVKKVVSGYTGGSKSTATYKQVTKGNTGHYEAVKITFDADVIPYSTLISMFLRSVDPTDAGGQFCDRGDSYRTAIFASGAAQTAAAKDQVAKAQSALGRKIVTPVKAAKAFYPAEDYHQDYAKSGKIVITRFGPLSKAKAYKRYRAACGRDKRVKQLWGSAAAFAR